jgi:hypothetical protein
VALKRAILTLGFVGVALAFAHAFALPLELRIAAAARGAALCRVLAGARHRRWRQRLVRRPRPSGAPRLRPVCGQANLRGELRRRESR